MALNVVFFGIAFFVCRIAFFLHRHLSVKEFAEQDLNHFRATCAKSAYVVHLHLYMNAEQKDSYLSEQQI